MSNKNKDKGKGYERDVAKYLTSELGGNFERIPNSGAFVGGKNAFRKESLTNNQILLTRGDIIPPEKYQNFVVECKNYKEFPFHQFLDPEKRVNLLDSWIKDIEHDAPEEILFWMIFIKINRKGEYVVWDSNRWLSNELIHFYDEKYHIAEKNFVFAKYGTELIERIQMTQSELDDMKDELGCI